MNGLNGFRVVATHQMPSSADRLDDVGEIDIDGWRRIDDSADTDAIELVSDDRKDKIVIKSVELQNDEVPYGYLIEYHEGESPYATYRNQCGSVIATSPGRVTVRVRELIAEYRDGSQE